jgi:predicted short-subunit dehydrogenase-like oxidoreductase (DUF2520 family)
MDRHQRELPALAIIGAGRVGHAIERLAHEAGIEVRLAARDDAAAAAADAEAALICVPDSAIAEACEAIAGASSLRFVGHSSGAVGADPLASATAAGAATFGLHPLQTIPDREAELAGAGCAVTGSTEEALDFARSLAKRLRMRPFEISEEQRGAYHAAAAIASNFLLCLEESAAELLDRSGIENGRELLAPLVMRSAANWAERGGEALTGPIARGDEATVSSHLAAIEAQMPELLELYEALATRTRAIAAQRSGAPA